ncbi:MAG: LacI family DNA-binding transcriptional regulator [Roseburia sp.]|nr:LacI family DNA-binding transcriptional regulator [Roseburia sp.]MCM1098013.1 LacI family DNA-binding transcriptional regulator [Ruminococcus flavefaciens]
MTQQNSPPTMKDVAREAGVALGTVSKVMNGIPVGESYRIRVEEAVAKLNYRVNNYAKGLKSNQTYIIAVMTPNLINPFFAKLVDHINRSLTRRRYRMLFYATDYDPQQEQELVILAEQQKVEGIICLSYNPELKVSANVPFVSIDRYFGSQFPCVSSDNYSGGRIAAEKLAENGCRNLAFMRIGSRLTNEPTKRKDGFINACEAMNIPYTLKIVEDGTPYSAFEDFLQEHITDGKLEFDGIFCVTDSLAHQIIHSLKSMGIRVPEDVQIIGFDGSQYYGDLEYCCSTIVQPLEDIAETCVDLVLQKNSSRPPSLVCLPVSYAYGGTTRS